MKIGVLTSPLINLSNIFYLDYHKLASDLSRLHDIYLVGSMIKPAAYPNACRSLPLISRGAFNGFVFLGYLRRSKYMKLISNNVQVFSYFRRTVDTKFDSKVINFSSDFFYKNNINLLYSFPFYPELFPTRLAKLLNVPLILEFWEDQICFNYETDLSEGIPYKLAIKEKNRGYSWLRELAISANHVIVPSTVFKNRLHALGVNQAKISIVPVCTHPFSQKDKTYVKTIHQLNGQKIIYYVGSMSPWHDLTCLITAVSKLLCPNVVLVLSGGTKYLFETFLPCIKKLNVTVIYTGKLSPDELDFYISAADVCVAPYKLTYSSGFFPGAVVRYMLAGKAIVATDLPEIREMFKGLNAGVLVQENNPQEMANAIDFFLEHPDQVIELGGIARSIAEKYYLWQHHTKKVTDILASISNSS
ncbi:MAG: glycosyltransferase family 4 protein [Candidatus Bathyarchaeia archaeon]|jgi:glycosyltransferase involved in cell wall biosynthesis